MRTRAVAAATLASAGVIAAGWQLGVQPAIAVQSQQTGTSASTGSGSAAGQDPATLGGTSNSRSSGSSNSTGSSTSGSAGSGAATSGSSGSTSGTTSGSASSSGTATNGTFTGQSVSTRFGNVQVQVTISSGKITEVTALQLTDDSGRSQMISSRAAPVLRSEVLQAQSANVDTVGGATYTSEAYLSSLQSALDSAHFKG